MSSSFQVKRRRDGERLGHIWVRNSTRLVAYAILMDWQAAAPLGGISSMVYGEILQRVAGGVI